MDLLIADELEFASVQMSPPAFCPGVPMRPFSMMSLVLTLVSCTSPQAEQPAAASAKANSTVTISKDNDKPPAPPVVRDDSGAARFLLV